MVNSVLSNDVYRECVKALAYGKSAEEVAKVMNVSEVDVKIIPQSHIKTEREYLIEMGYINGS